MLNARLKQYAVAALAVAACCATAFVALVTSLPQSNGVVAAQPFEPPHDEPGHEIWNWRTQRLPRIDIPPDPERIAVESRDNGWAVVRGAPGAVAVEQPGTIRIVNLHTGDQTAAAVHADGSFSARVFAPPGSALQLSASMLNPMDVPPEFREHLFSEEGLYLNGMHEGAALALGGFATSIDQMSAPTTSPGTIITVPGERGVSFVIKKGPGLWVYGRAELSQDRVRLREPFFADITLHVVSLEPIGDMASPEVVFGAHMLFDAQGRQLPMGRISASHLLTPTGLPIEAMGEMMVEKFPGSPGHYTPLGAGAPLGHHPEQPGAWRRAGERHMVIEQRYNLVVPEDVPHGIYGIAVHVVRPGDVEFDAGPQAATPHFAGMVRIGNPDPPRLAAVLLASTGSNGTRGAIARQDTNQFALNFRNNFSPDKLIIARDDAYTGEPVTYPLDPYAPFLGLMERPAPVVPPSPIPLNFENSELTVTVTAPSGQTATLGPAPLAHSQCDNSLIRPDTVVPGRVVPAIPPTYGNPSLAEIHHLSGHGAFDFAFPEYGRYEVELRGAIADEQGNDYELSGTYDVYVAREPDLEIFPEPGTPLYPERAYHPQVRVFPAAPADVEVRVRYYPYSEDADMKEIVITGRADRWGIFVADAADALSFDDPGEYVMDVTVSWEDEDGALWMAARRGASIVAEPQPVLVAHGERGVRSPTGLWRARWFRAGVPNFLAPPPGDVPVEPFPEDPDNTGIGGIDLGHVCYPYESGDVAWLGDTIAFSLFPNITFEDTRGDAADALEARWPGLRHGQGRAGLYPDSARGEDRRAIGELPYVNMTAGGLPPSVDPDDVDIWGYFYTTSWRPGVAVRSQVAEDTYPTGYWFFDDPYGFQYGNAPHGDVAGDVKMNYGGGVFRDTRTGAAHYSAYASMLVLIDNKDPLGPRVLPPFDGLVQGSPPGGPLLVAGDKRYDLFLTFGPAAPGAILEAGRPLPVSGVVWPPVEGRVDVTVTSPSGDEQSFEPASDAMGVFHDYVTAAAEPGVWLITAQGTATGRTSVGVLSDLVDEEDLPRGGGIGLKHDTYPVIVTAPGAEPIRFDAPPGSRARPPGPLIIRGRLPAGAPDSVHFLIRMPGQVIDSGELAAHGGVFEYVYDPDTLAVKFPNLDTRILTPHPFIEMQPAWFDTVSMTFWSGQGADVAAGLVLLQGEEIYARDMSGQPLPETPEADPHRRRPQHDQFLPLAEPQPWAGVQGAHSSLMQLSPNGDTLYAAHPWSQELVRLDVSSGAPHVEGRVALDGRPRGVALSPDGNTVFVSLSDVWKIAAFDADSLSPVARFGIPGEPRGLLSTPDGDLFVADFDSDAVMKVDAENGDILCWSDDINRPHALAAIGDEVYAASFRTGEILVMDSECETAREISTPAQLNQAETMTAAGDGLLYAPQTRSDTVVGGLTFDRSVFPAIAVADPQQGDVRIAYFPDLLVTPPHRPAETAVDEQRVYTAFAGSDDVLAMSRRTGLAVWHTTDAGMEPGALVLDEPRGRLYLMTVAGQEIVTLDADTGGVLSRTRFTEDPTPERIARGRYLFNTATDERLTKDRWMSCASCHPDGYADGRQWDFGHGPLDTASLHGSLRTPPLHEDGHLDEIQDTYRFTKMVMAGMWFIPREEMHDYLGESNAGLDADLDALAAYIDSLEYDQAPSPPDDDEPLLERGREIFMSPDTGCARCHPAPYYTDSGARDAAGGYVLHDVGTSRPGGPSRLDTPTLLGLRRTDPYLHHGGAKTLEEIFTKFNPDDRHGKTSHLGDEDIHALALFLEYLGQ